MNVKAVALINGRVLQATSLEVLPDMKTAFHDTTLRINVLPSGLYWFGVDASHFQTESLATSFRRGDIALLRISAGNERFLRCCACDGFEQSEQDPEPARRCRLRLRYSLRRPWKARVERVVKLLVNSLNRDAQLFLADWLDDYGRPQEADRIRRSIAKQQTALRSKAKRQRR